MTLLSKPVASLELARAMIDAAMAESRLRSLIVAISIVDDGGHPIASARMNGVSPISSYIAEEKARTAAISWRETKLFEAEINDGRTAFLSTSVKGALEGGIPLKVGGHVVAAIGIAGCKPELSAAIARASIAAHIDE